MRFRWFPSMIFASIFSCMVHTGVGDTRIDVDGCLLRRPLKFVASTTVTVYFPYGSRASSLAWGDRRKVLFRVGGGIVDRRLCLLLAIVLQVVAPISGAPLPCQTEVSFRGTLEPTQWRWKCGQVRIAGLKASSRACTRPTVTSLLMHSHSPSAQAHFVPELTVWGIASESKFVHQFFMTYSLCVAARFSAWIVSGFSRRPIFHGISNRSLAARHGDVVCVPPGSSVVGSFLDVFRSTARCL